jgi:hypothetical protein
MLRSHIVDRDALVAELSSAGEDLQRLDERCVGPVVDRQRPCLARGAGGLQVGDHVAATEGVDGLLRVADEHERGVTGEGAVEDVPLDRVGVLELIDQHDAPALAHPVAGRRVVVAEGGGEAAEQVVVREDAEPLLATLELEPHVLGEPDPVRLDGTGLGVDRSEMGLRVTDGLPPDGERRRWTERRSVVVLAELPEVEVTDDFDHQLVEVLHERDAGVGVTGHAE